MQKVQISENPQNPILRSEVHFAKYGLHPLWKNDYIHLKTVEMCL